MGSKSATRSVRASRGAKRGGGNAEKERIALTVKVDGELYVRLNTFRARKRKTSQEVLEEALKEYLARAGE